MSATEYDIHDELIQNECIRLHTHFKDRILQEKDFFELNNAVLRITEYIVKLERENCIRNIKTELTKEDIVVGKSLGIEGQLSQRRSRWTK